jgi:hypothetical protein
MPMAEYASNPAGSGAGYALNPFAGSAGGGKTAAYAQGLRNYTGNTFGGEGATSSNTTGPLAAHLTQAVPLDADLMQAYKDVAADPQAQQYKQAMNYDLEKLWKLSPTAPIFKAGYAHNPYVLQRQQAIAEARRQAGLTAEERAAEDAAKGYYTPDLSGGT